MANRNRVRAATGNLSSEVHGAEGGVKALQRGRPFTGMAAAMEREVHADLEAIGRYGMLLEIAERSHTVLRLFYDALQAAADEGDLDKVERFGQRFGWLAGVAGRAWRDVQHEEQASGRAGALSYAELLSDKRQAAEQAAEQHND